MKKILAWLKQEDGNSGIEYALIASLGVILLASAYAMLGGILFDWFSTFVDSVNPF